MEENTQPSFLAYYMLYYLKKDKNATEKRKKRSVQCGEGAVTDRTYQKLFAKFLGAIDILAK